MSKAQLATVWLDGCSGCHMSLLDLDEGLLDLADRIDLVYSPLVDAKVFPEHVDVTLVEGAVANEEDLHKIRHIRARTRILVALGDCAVTSNIPGLRNPFGVQAVLRRACLQNVAHTPQLPGDAVPQLLKRVRPVHEVVAVDVFIPGCPPSAATIRFALGELLEGRVPDLIPLTRFGA